MCTQHEKRKRLDHVVELLILGSQRREILQYAANQEWTGDNGKPVCPRTVDLYIHEANEELALLSEVHREEQIGKARARLERLFAKSYQIQDYKTCRAIQKDVSLLFGLDAPSKVENSGPDGGPMQVHVTYDDPGPSPAETA